MLPASKIDSFIFFLLSVKFLLSDLFLSLPLAACFFCRHYQLSLSYRHFLTSSSSCHYLISSFLCHYLRHFPLSVITRHSPLSVITRLDRVIPLPSPILRMPRSSRSMTGWNNNYSTFPFLSSYPTFLSPAFSSFCHYPT